MSYRDEKRLLTHLIGVLEQNLSGRTDQFIHRVRPSDHCQLGVLSPWSRDSDQEEQPSENPTLAGPSLRDEIESAAASDGAKSKAKPPRETVVASTEVPSEVVEPFAIPDDAGRRPPSAIGMAFVVDGFDGEVEISVDAEFAIYTRHFPDFDVQSAERGNVHAEASEAKRSYSLVDKFARHRISIPGVSFRFPMDVTSVVDDGQKIQRVIEGTLDPLKKDPTVLREFDGHRTVPADRLTDAESFSRFLATLAGAPLLPRFKAGIRARCYPTKSGLRIEIFLCNNTERDNDRPSNDQYRSLYDAVVRVRVTRGRLQPVELLPVPEDYQYDRNVFAIGRNTSVEVDQNSQTISTRSLAMCEQIRMRTHDRIEASFSALAEDPLPLLQRIYDEMLQYQGYWRSIIIEQNHLGLRDRELISCGQDLDAFSAEATAFAEGVAALGADAKLLDSFKAMNHAFASGRHQSWRLFQIVFVVSQLPSLALREGISEGQFPKGTYHSWEDALERADVLWFPTGGGKTEAYFGLIGCAALYDRLRGKHQGVTAWLRFPLRMLSVQQLQRAVQMVWAIEQQRLILEEKMGSLGDPFSLGYFVGSSNTPNSFFGSWSFDRLEQDESQRNRLLLVPDCPCCGGEGTVGIVLNREYRRVMHVCGSCDAKLPVHVSDEEVFRFQPTLIVGTIDKVASVGYQKLVASLWRGPQWRCPIPDHGYGNGDWCVSGCPTNPTERNPNRLRRISIIPRDPSPALHIQDELHLLQEDLGAFAGHYETMVRANERKISRQPAKVIAATATISGFDHQARQIYGVRTVRRFPNRSFSLEESFYSMQARSGGGEGDEPIIARIFVAFRPPFLRPADAAVTCAEILHREINCLHADPQRARALAHLIDAQSDNEVRDLLKYYSRSLTYVTKRDNGVRIRQRLEQESSREGNALRPNGERDLNVEYLSSRSSLREIAAAVKRAEADVPWNSSGHLDATVATDVISHGVDVEYFNLMLLERIPESIGNYIQISSRSGRQHLGLVLSVLPRFSLRASSIYHRFSEFHRYLDRMVKPVPVNRFAKAAVSRTFPGVLLGTIYSSHLNDLNGAKEERLRRVSQGLDDDAGPISADRLYQDLLASYAIKEGRYEPALEKQMEERIRESWQRFLFEVRHPSHHDLTEIFDPKPMTSLRDVDVPVPFRPDDEAVDWRELQWFSQRA